MTAKQLLTTAFLLTGCSTPAEGAASADAGTTTTGRTSAGDEDEADTSTGFDASTAGGTDQGSTGDGSSSGQPDADASGSSSGGVETTGSDSDDPFPLPAAGCPMSHCEPSMSDRNPVVLPTDAEILWHDDAPVGSSFGVGCSSNGIVAACSYGGSPGLVVYDGEGEPLWDSGELLSNFTWTSAPVVGGAGEVIAADAEVVVRFDADGTPNWVSKTPGGRPISPVIIDEVVFLATQGGPVSTYDVQTGAPLDSLALELDGRNLDTVNTPCADDGRAYVLAQDADDASFGALVAIDLDPRAGTLTQAWAFAFGGPSGASPLLVDGTVYFDGGAPEPGQEASNTLFAVRDDGDRGVAEWIIEGDGGIQASFAADPRGGFWSFPVGQGRVTRRSFEDGSVLQDIDINPLIDSDTTYTPSSVMTVFGDDDAPTLVFASISLSLPTSGIITAIDLVPETLRWSVDMPQFTAVQFPTIETDDGRTVIVASSRSTGAFGIGEPARP